MQHSALTSIFPHLPQESLRSAYQSNKLTAIFFCLQECPQLFSVGILSRATIRRIWRRVWDSNPRAVAGKRFSRPPRCDHFDNPPYIWTLYHARPHSSRRNGAFLRFFTRSRHTGPLWRRICGTGPRRRPQKATRRPSVKGIFFFRNTRVPSAVRGSPRQPISRHTGRLSRSIPAVAAALHPGKIFKSFAPPLAFLRAFVYNNRRCWLPTHSQSS